MKKVTVTKQVNASANKLWNIVKTGDAVNEWIPIIASCNLMGRGAGAKRSCTTGDGQMLEETIVSINDLKKEFVYTIDKQELMPITNVVNKLKISESMGGTQVEWVAEFDMHDESMFPAVEQGLKGLFDMGITGLETLAMKN